MDQSAMARHGGMPAAAAEGRILRSVRGRNCGPARASDIDHGDGASKPAGL